MVKNSNETRLAYGWTIWWTSEDEPALPWDPNIMEFYIMEPLEHLGKLIKKCYVQFKDKRSFSTLKRDYGRCKVYRRKEMRPHYFTDNACSYGFNKKYASKYEDSRNARITRIIKKAVLPHLVPRPVVPYVVHDMTFMNDFQVLDETLMENKSG